jgi:cytosine/adenosine deaminase-related metal-dependent hydrolase
MRRSWACQAAGRRRNDVDLAPLGDVPAELAFCFATGNTARMRELDCGLIEVGRSADFVIMDKAQHSAGKTILDSVQFGDLPGIGMTIINGIVAPRAAATHRRRPRCRRW